MSGSSFDFLLNLPRYDKRGAASLKPGFDRIERILSLAGNPHRAYTVAHIAGTNGKGSTSSMLAAIGTSSGLRVGLQTSPHLFDVTERMRIDGLPASHEWLDRTVSLLRRPLEKIGPSFFEAVTALSFIYFAEMNVDLAVVEVGLGGRLDATNVVDPAVCAISAIGIDHVAILGDTVRAIAAEKAGIIKPGVPVVTSNDDPEIIDVLRSAAENRNAPFETIATHFPVASVENGSGRTVLHLVSTRHDYGRVELDLAGSHQVSNALLAVAAAEHLIPDPMPAVRTGLANTRRLSGLRGRLEVLRTRPMIVADVGHNESGIATALAFARSECAGRLHVAIGLLRDKDCVAIARRVAAVADFVHVIPLAGERALEAERLVDVFRKEGAPVASVADAQTVADAFVRTASTEDCLLLAGSHQVVAQLDQNLLFST